MLFGVFRGRFLVIFDDFLKTKKMRNVRTIILAAVSRRDLCYVSENKVSVFEKHTSFVRNLVRKLPS